MGEHVSKPREVHRSSFCKDLKIFLDTNVILKGVSRDISINSISMFISLKGAAPFFKNNGIDIKHINLNDIKKVLKEQIILVAFEHNEIELEPMDMKVLRIEVSWQKAYDIFIAGQLENIDEFTRKKIESIEPEVEQKVHEKRYKSSKLPIFKKMLESHHAHKIKIEYTNSYNQVLATRDYITNLVSKYSFPKEEQYQLKLISDEALMNAFLYGSTLEGRNHTEINIEICQYGVLVEITDFAGKYFDDTPYHSRKNLTMKQLGGLTLIGAYSDDWQVVTLPNKKTTLTFFKSNSQPSDIEE